QHLECRRRWKRGVALEVQSSGYEFYALSETTKDGGHAKNSDHQRRRHLVFTARQSGRSGFWSAVPRHGQDQHARRVLSEWTARISVQARGFHAGKSVAVDSFVSVVGPPHWSPSQCPTASRKSPGRSMTTAKI